MKIKHTHASFHSAQQRIHAAGRHLAWAAVLSLLVCAPKTIQAQTTNLYVGSNVVWGTASAWSPANIPNALDTMVTFNNTTNTILNPGSSVTYTLGTLNLTATSGTIGLAGANLVLNLQTSSGTPVINCSGGAGLYWYFTTTGTQGFTKLGSGTLTSRFNNTPNTFSGPVIVGQGGLQLQLAGSLANASSLTISNAAGAGLSLANSANGSTTPFGNIYTILPATLPIYFQGGGAPVIQVNYVGQTMTILGNVLGTSGSALTYKGPGTTILAGTNYFVGNSATTGGTIDFSTTTTNTGTLTVSANATNGVIATAPGSSMVVSNLTLIGTNNSILAFNPGWSGTLPAVPMLNVTNNLAFVTNVPAPIVLSGGGWQTGNSIPLLQYGTLVNTNAAGVFGSFALGALPQGFTAALVDGTATSQINLNLSAIVPLVWNPATAGSYWTNTGVWSLGGTAGKTYTEVNLMGSSVQFDDSLTPAGPSILVTNNWVLSPNNVVFNNSTHSYTLMGSGAIANNTGITKSGTGYLTNSLANYYFGNTVLNGGVMVLNNATALGYGGTISFNGGTLQFSANNKNDYSSRFSPAPNQAYSLNTGGQTITLAKALTSSGGSLTKLGAGTLTLNAGSSYTGPTTNAAGTLKLGVANAIPTTSALTLGGNSTAATFDLAGQSQQVPSLAMDPSASGAIITNSSTSSVATLIYNGGTSTFDGVILDGMASGAKSLALTVAGGSLTLPGNNGPNTYTGNTTITNGGTLVIGSGNYNFPSINILVGSGSTLDLSGVSYSTPAGGSLSGVGTVNGSVTAVYGSIVQSGFYGAYTNHGTLTFNNDLTLNTGAAAALHVDTTVGSANNDKLSVNGTVYANDPSGNTINISALNGAAALATGTDYTLISSPNPISGSFNVVPIWLGTKPSNYANFTVVTSGNTVKLHYSASVLLSGVGAVNPVSGLHQKYVFSVAVTPGTGSTGIGVTADFGIIGGSVQTFAGVGNLFSYTNAVPGSVAPGNYLVPFTVTDAQANTYNGTIGITIVNGALTWNGGAGDNNWSSLNWLNGAVPDSSGTGDGDALVFAGTTRLSPVMDNSFNVSAVTFSNNAGAFNVTSTGGSLTLGANGLVENDAISAQRLAVPINLTSGSQFKTLGGNLTVSTLAGSGGFAKSGSGKLTVDGMAGTSSFSGTVNLGGGTLAISNANDVLPTSSAIACTGPAAFDLGGNSQTIDNLTTAGGFTNTIGNGNLAIGANANFNIYGNSSTNTLVDMSGLANLTYAQPGRTLTVSSINNSTTSVSWLTDLNLAMTNNITASVLQLGVGTGSAGGVNFGTLHLGQANFLNMATINLSQYRGNGNLNFLGRPNSTLFLRGVDGTSPVNNINILNANSGASYTSSIDLSGGVVDIYANNLLITERASNGGNYIGSFVLGAGSNVVDILNVTIAKGDNFGVTAGTTNSSGSCNGTMTQNGGRVTVGTLTMGVNNQSQYTITPINATYNLFGGTLYAQTITLGANNGLIPNGTVTSIINWTTGTLQNYPASDLTVSGVSINLGNPIGIPVFNVDAGQNITLDTASPVIGVGKLTKAGPGNLILNGTNTYSGSTTVSAGTLEIAMPTLNSYSTVTVSNGAALKLDFPATVTNQVAVLIINGVSKAPGVYNNSTDPTYLTGTGSLLVVPLSTNAYLTSLALNPADSLTPNFATNLSVYFATNVYGISPTVTVTNANLAATNKLFLNGVALQVLASGVPSLALTNLGVGSTNVLKVLVTAQDGVTTNLYTVNLTELPPVLVNTNTFTITNIVSGNNLDLSWPADRKGWRLQVQTNSINVGLGNVWYDWPNSTNLTSVSIPLNPANPSVFLRMVYP